MGTGTYVEDKLQPMTNERTIVFWSTFLHVTMVLESNFLVKLPIKLLVYINITPAVASQVFLNIADLTAITDTGVKDFSV